MPPVWRESARAGQQRQPARRRRPSPAAKLERRLARPPTLQPGPGRAGPLGRFRFRRAQTLRLFAVRKCGAQVPLRLVLEPVPVRGSLPGAGRLHLSAAPNRFGKCLGPLLVCSPHGQTSIWPHAKAIYHAPSERHAPTGRRHLHSANRSVRRLLPLPAPSWPSLLPRRRPKTDQELLFAVNCLCQS